MSSVLDDDTASYGPSHLFDGLSHTTWCSGSAAKSGGAAGLPASSSSAATSAGGPAPSLEPQWVTVKLSRPVRLSGVAVTFQGGFAATQVAVSAGGPHPTIPKKLTIAKVGTFAAVDTNSTQHFTLPAPTGPVSVVKVAFAGFTDFFGRVYAYDLALLGEEVEAELSADAEADKAIEPST